jgi:hypothetical protein
MGIGPLVRRGHQRGAREVVISCGNLDRTINLAPLHVAVYARRHGVGIDPMRTSANVREHRGHLHMAAHVCRNRT